MYRRPFCRHTKHTFTSTYVYIITNTEYLEVEATSNRSVTHIHTYVRTTHTRYKGVDPYISCVGVVGLLSFQVFAVKSNQIHQSFLVSWGNGLCLQVATETEKEKKGVSLVEHARLGWIELWRTRSARVNVCGLMSEEKTRGQQAIFYFTQTQHEWTV